MKIGIIGHGFVGRAISHAHRDQTLVIRDPKLGKESASIEKISSCDAIYLCVPTPMSEDGHCDDSNVKSVLEELSYYDKVIISKSTVPPGVYKKLNTDFPNLVHAPEFLTAANAVSDYLNAQWMIIGGQSPWIKDAVRVVSSGKISSKHFYETDIETAAFFKYLANTYLASKVVLMNEFYKLAKNLNIDWNEIKALGMRDLRLGNSHWDVPGPDGQFGYGGACFPKDIAAIIEHGLDLGIDLTLLSHVKEINKKLRH